MNEIEIRDALIELESDPGEYLCERTIKLAIQALQEKAEREENKALTAEDLKQMVGQPIWVKCSNCSWLPNNGYYGIMMEQGLLCPSMLIINYETLENWELYQCPPKEES